MYSAWQIHKPEGPIEFYDIHADALPDGKSISEWTVAWWQWLIGIPKDRNPALDQTGKFSSQGQSTSSSVYFLVGTTMAKTIERRCDVPKNKPVLFPVVNDEESVAEKPAFAKALPKLTEDAGEDQDNIISMEANFDKNTEHEVSLLTGSLVKNRVRTGMFDLNFPVDNIFDCASGPSKASSDGYWLFLKPLPGPQHTIHFNAIEDDYSIELTYYITVT